MNNEVLIKNGNRAEWGADSAPIEPERLPEGYPHKEARVSVDASAGFGEGAAYYLVSENIPESVAAGMAVVAFTGTNYPGTLSAQNEDNTLLMAPERLAFICLADRANLEGLLTFPKRGVYFLGGNGIFVCQKLDLGNTGVWDYEYSGSTKIIHPIAADFLPLATPTAAGVMKQAAAVANVTAAPTAEEFNALLKSLRDAGILATE